MSLRHLPPLASLFTANISSISGVSPLRVKVTDMTSTVRSHAALRVKVTHVTSTVRSHAVWQLHSLAHILTISQCLPSHIGNS